MNWTIAIVEVVLSGVVFRKAFPVHSSYAFTVESAVFDEQNLVSAAGLVPVLELAEQTGLSRLIGEHVDLASTQHLLADMPEQIVPKILIHTHALTPPRRAY